MLSKKLLSIILIAIITLMFFSCPVIIKELIPKKPSEYVNPKNLIQIDEDSLLPIDEISIQKIAINGYNEPHTPPNVKPTPVLKNFLIATKGDINLNQSSIIKIQNKNLNTPKRIIIIITGIYSGAGTIANLGIGIARRLIDSEVWIWERRSNALEDRIPILQAIKDNTTDKLVKILKEDSIKKSFYQPSTKDISFVGYWGLNVYLGDLLAIVKEARKRTEEVDLIGYSLGGLFATTFLANDFSNINKSNKKIPGYSFVDKVALFDGLSLIEGYVKNESQYKSGVNIIPKNFIEGVDKLESGRYYPCSATVNRDFSEFFKRDIDMTLAKLDKNGLYYKKFDDKFPITNEAYYLSTFDENYVNFKLFTVSAGIANAKSIGKYSITNTMKIVGLHSGMDRISWISPTNKMQNEYNNPDSLFKFSETLLFNMVELYQPTKILLDFGSIHYNDTSNGWQSKYFNITENANINNPFLCIGLSRGLNANPKTYLKFKTSIKSNDFSIITIGNITHVDGGSISDEGSSHQYLADIYTHWLEDAPIIKKTLVNDGVYLNKKYLQE